MPDQISTRIFISYSRKDGAGFAADLRQRLLKEKLSVWQDLVALEGGRDWWTQIEGALKSKTLQHFVLVVTPAALASSVVRDEIRLARQEGKSVSPVRGPDLRDLNAVPRWLGHVYDLAIPEQRTNFIRVLQGPSTQRRVPMMAPEPPRDYVQRPIEFEALKRQLLDAKGDSVAITAALRGAGGYGKTTIAKALAYDADIQDAYFDGILWVELGENPGDPLPIISDLVEILSGERPGLENTNAGAAKLGEALGDRRILMIVDDAWREQDLRPFLHGGPRTTRLITTRLNRVLPPQAFRQPVDAMTGPQASELLSSGLPPDQVFSQTGELKALAGRLGEWAQLLRLVNGFLRERVVESSESLSQAIIDANIRLSEEGLDAFNADEEGDRTKAVARTINLSLGLLDDNQRSRFTDLAVFPEDADIPIGVVTLLWRQTVGLSESKTKDLLVKFYGLSLLLGLDLNQRTFRFHDTVRYFLRHQAGREALVAKHTRLLRAIEDVSALDHVDALTRRYYYLHLPYHLAEVSDRERLDALLLDPGWLAAKLSVTENPQTLVSDYELYAVGETQNLIGRTLRLTAGICARDRRQLIPQLLGRLMGRHDPGMPEFLDVARRQIGGPALLTQGLSLTPPGAETARLEGHIRWVTALCVLPDGRLASGSDDNTIRLWDATTGVETARLHGHTDGVNALCLLSDGQLASCSDDRTIRLWDVKTCEESIRFEGHSDNVKALCLLVDGRLVSGSSDNTIRVWDVNSGGESIRFEGHSAEVNALCLLRDGRLASASSDQTIRVWNVGTGAEDARLEGHRDLVKTLCLLPDGRLASGSRDTTIRLWDVSTGAETGRLDGHTARVASLCVLPEGRLASGSYDTTIRLWDLNTGAETTRFEGHSDWVEALCMLPDGRLASGSYDQSIRLWDIATITDISRPKEHRLGIRALCLLQDGRVASGSEDETIRLWDVTSGVQTACIEGHSRSINALCVLPDGRLASGSGDSSIRLWDVTNGVQTACIQGRSGRIHALCVLPDGRLASGSTNKTIGLWDVTTGSQTACLQGHSDSVWALCMLPNGRLASGSTDHTIRLWDTNAGVETMRLEGSSDVYTLCPWADRWLISGDAMRLWDTKNGEEVGRLEGKRILALCVLPDGRLASGSSDHTVRLWDVRLGTGREVARLELDAAVICLAALPDGRLLAGDQLGRLHWLEIVG
jgi:WD40 repeat protein